MTLPATNCLLLCFSSATLSRESVRETNRRWLGRREGGGGLPMNCLPLCLFVFSRPHGQPRERARDRQTDGGRGVSMNCLPVCLLVFFSATRSIERACERQTDGGKGGGVLPMNCLPFFFFFLFSATRSTERACERQTNTEKEWWGVAGRHKDRRRRERRSKERGVPGGRQRERGVT